MSCSLQNNYLESNLSFEAYSFYTALFPLANYMTGKVTLSQTDIASELQIHKSRVSRYLSELLLEGWIAYVPVQGSHRVKPIQLLFGWWDTEQKMLESDTPDLLALSSPNAVVAADDRVIPKSQQVVDNSASVSSASDESPTSVPPHVLDLEQREDRGGTEVEQRIAGSHVPVDVERSLSVKQLTGTNNKEQGAAPHPDLIIPSPLETKPKYQTIMRDDIPPFVKPLWNIAATEESVVIDGERFLVVDDEQTVELAVEVTENETPATRPETVEAETSPEEVNINQGKIAQLVSSIGDTQMTEADNSNDSRAPPRMSRDEMRAELEAMDWRDRIDGETDDED